jgi:hypothetical protein
VIHGASCPFVVSLTSLVSSETDEGRPALRQASKAWRLRWWGDIIGLTVGGRSCCLGKGYAITLANDDGRPVGHRTPRSPHDVSMTALARSGVSGLLLWRTRLATFLSCLLRRALPGASGVAEDRAVAASKLAYPTAFPADASFGVFLESLMGGIPFWSLIGISRVRPRDDRRRGEAAAAAALA